MTEAATKNADTTSKSAFYTKPAVLSSIDHREVKIAGVDSFDFAKDLNSSVLVGHEFMESAKTYPVVFIEQGADTLMPVAIMGLNNNLFVDAEGKWQENAYVPAFIRRYPFIVAEGLSEEDGALTVCIDTAYSGYDKEDGERLFDDDGKQTAFMENAMKFIEEYQQQYELTKVFVKFVKDHDLLKSVNASITMADGQKFNLPNLQIIDEEKLKDLADEDLLLLARKGFLAWVYAHLFSISNFARVINKK
ncbi:MAG: SapC family protein [Deltaproteobacteria bacterium]|nr:SapC family protein [Deltaproteobacteria bacterium]